MPFYKRSIISAPTIDRGALDPPSQQIDTDPYILWATESAKWYVMLDFVHK